MTGRLDNVVALPAPQEPFLTREELAHELRVHVNTLDAWRREAGFPQERWGPRTVRFQLGPVVAWLRDRERRAA